jgi:formylglycine-generating enzyme required for sulfatase activity
VTPDHGAVMTIPVKVLTGRRSAVGRAAMAVMGVIVVASLAWLAISQLGSGGVRGILGPAETPVPPTAESLDAATVALDGLEIDQYEVTNLQYQRYKPDHRYDPGEELYPAVHVTWTEAQAYCEWMEKRLPTEEEWQRAAGGEEGWIYPWGNEADPSRLNSDNNRETDGLVRVDAFTEGKTPSGIYQLLGNASEWVTGSADHPQTHCGGSWRDFGLTNSRCFWEADPNSAAETIGFRCIRRVATEEPLDSESEP